MKEDKDKESPVNIAVPLSKKEADALDYAKLLKEQSRARTSKWNKFCLSIFICVCMLTDVWKFLHSFFPQQVPSYEKSFSDTISSFSSVRVEPYILSKHHSFDDFSNSLNEEAFNYLKSSYENNSIPNRDTFDKLSKIDFNNYAEEVKLAINHSWYGYKTGGWGFDSVRPVTGEGVNDFSGFAMTMIDSIDTLYIAGFHDEITEIKDWLVKNFRIEKQTDVNIFEVNIRVLGGLLSAFHLTKDEDFRIFAEYVASKLVQSFVEPSGVPYGLASYGKIPKLSNSRWTNGCSSVAEAGTLGLEFFYITQLTGQNVFYQTILKLNKWFHKLVFTNVDVDFEKTGQSDMLRDGLLPTYLDPVSGYFSPCKSHQKYSMGGSVDSVYEYFLKLYIMSGKNKVNKKAKELYLKAIEGSMKHLLRVTRGEKKYLYLGERLVDANGGVFLHNMDHLACYVPGMLALGVYHNVTVDEEQSVVHLDLAKHLMRTCYESYKTTKTGLAPEVMAFSRKYNNVVVELSPKINGKHSFHRPETVESLHLLYEVTGDPIYKLWALEIFKAIQKNGKVKFGYSGVKDVDAESGKAHNNKMESFFISETLKYLLLMFSDEDIFPLDEYVFNTEAHPFPILK